MIELEAEIVVFDLDDTLYLEEDFARSGFDALARQFGERIGGARFARECAALLADGKRGNIFDLALARCNIAGAPGLVDELVAFYRSHRPDIELCPDAARFFARIEQMPTGIITDGPKETQWAKIKALGLNRTINHLIVTGDWGREFFKPHPRAFIRIENVTSSSGENLVYIADNAIKDFITPRRRGWQTVQIRRPDRIHAGDAETPDHEADHAIASLDDLRVRAPVLRLF